MTVSFLAAARRAGLVVAGLLLIALAGAGCAGAAEPFHAGVVRMSVAADVVTLAWYPTQGPEVAWDAGPFRVPATRDAPIAPGRFPIVLLSHGGGPTGGTPFLLNGLAAALARHGFVVIAPFHGKTGLAGRPRQIGQALKAVLADPRLAAHADPERIGMVGFSLGGAVTLELAGAVPNPAHLMSYCSTHPADVMSCDHAPSGHDRPPAQGPAGEAPASVPFRLKAIVLLDPFAVLFQRPELAAVTMPVLIVRPTGSALPAEANAAGLAAGLPGPPQVQSIPGSHFVFTDVCSPALAAAAPEVCRDPPGVDRTAVHAAVEARVIAFLASSL
jgi:predicted dienelactone hydrolase